MYTQIYKQILFGTAGLLVISKKNITVSQTKGQKLQTQAFTLI